MKTRILRNSSNFLYIYIYIFFVVNFENLTVEFYILYILNKHIGFYINQMLFIIQPINLFFIHNFRSQKLEILIFV